MATRTRRTTKAASLEIDVPDTEVSEPNIDNAVDVTPSPKRKYFSHENCSHARKGDAGKAARAQCRRAIRSWLAAEAEFNAAPAKAS